MDNKLKIEIHDDVVTFYKVGWKQVAHLDNIPELIELVKNSSWHDNNGYLFSSKYKKYLHRLVMEHKIGEAALKELTEKGFVVDHINNREPYNCCLDNLHVISSDKNKAKGFTVDKDIEKVRLTLGIGLYCLKDGDYQIAIGFNAPTAFYINDEWKSLATMHLTFNNFEKCYNAIQIILTWAKGEGDFIINHLQASRYEYSETVNIELTEEEKASGAIFIKRGDKFYFKLSNAPDDKIAIIDKPAKKE